MLALLLVGSLAQRGAAPDEWSDLDLLLLVRDHALPRYYPDTAWLRTLGEPWAWEQPGGGVTLMRFADLRRLDLVIKPESDLPSIGEWGRRLLGAGHRVLFSRSPELHAALARGLPRPAYSPPPPERLEEMASKFWFAASVVVYKVVRGDLLIASHLALELQRDCLALAMMLRDRDAGTTHHPKGAQDEELLSYLLPASLPPSPAGLLDVIEHTARAYDELCAEWSPAHRERREPLLRLIDRARAVPGR